MTALRAAVARVQAVWVRLQHQATMDRVSIDRHVANGNDDLAQPYRAMAAQHNADADALALVLRALSEREWQGMETAPEAEYVIVWLPNYGAHRAIKTTTHGVATWWSDHGTVNPVAWVRPHDPPVDLAPALAEER